MLKQSVFIALIIFWLTVGGVLIWKFAWPKPQTTSSVPAATVQPQPNSTPTPTAPQLTRTELAKHNSSASCWLLISGNLYDVTNFLPIHPGGENRILPYCGKDATQAFATQGGEGQHSSDAKDTLAEYKLGPLQ